MLTTLVLALLVPAQQEKPAYAKPNLLAHPAALKSQDSRKGFVILDARRKAEYLLGHVPVEGEAVEFQGLEFRAERVQGRRILTVRITPKESEPAESAAT